MQLETVRIRAEPMIYVRYRVGMDSSEIGEKMGEAFQRLGRFIGENAIGVAGPPRAIYHDYAEDGMTMDVAFPVPAAALGMANNDVKAGQSPSGTALMFRYQGPYDGLRETYDAIGEQLKAEGRPMSPLCWEVYLNDPDDTAPENLVTEIFMQVEEQD